MVITEVRLMGALCKKIRTKSTFDSKDNITNVFVFL